jgi:hypothetical protein
MFCFRICFILLLHGPVFLTIIALVFNTEPGWAEEVKLTRNFIEDLKWPNFKLWSVHGEFRNNGMELRKAPISGVKFMIKIEKFSHVVRYSSI